MAAEAEVAAEEVRDEASADEAVVVFVVFAPEETALPTRNMDNPIIKKTMTRINRRKNRTILRFLFLACLFRDVG